MVIQFIGVNSFHMDFQSCFGIKFSGTHFTIVGFRVVMVKSDVFNQIENVFSNGLLAYGTNQSSILSFGTVFSGLMDVIV